MNMGVKVVGYGESKGEVRLTPYNVKDDKH
jgi:hypothetical protein